MTVKKDGFLERLNKTFNPLLWFFGACFIFLWFKGNFPAFKPIPISASVPLVLWISVLSAKLILFFQRGRFKRKGYPKGNNFLLVLILILLLAAAFRIPFLLDNFGLVTSDDAVPVLMGKHIAEGKLPPIYYYGQLYMGSLSEHVYGLLFFLFGYSVLLFLLSSLLFYLSFIAVQFFFLKDVFSVGFASAASLFYCLPIGHLMRVSFDGTGAFSLVLFLGSALVYVAYLISFKDKKRLVPALGFLMGLSFWTHQISAAFILTALIALVYKFRLQLKKYASLLIFAAIGSLPLLVLEIQEGFSLLQYLFPEGSSILGGGKIQRAVDITQSLLSLKTSPLVYLFLFLVAFGFIALILTSIKKKAFFPRILFPVFFVIFLTMYLLSDFSRFDIERYLYPLYFCLPVLMLAIFFLIKGRMKYFFAAALVLSLFFLGSYREQIVDGRANRSIDRHLRQVIDRMGETGRRYWQGNYWSAYLITALSGEKIIVDSTTVNRYLPYRLEYYNQGENNNFVFLRGEGSTERQAADRLIDLLDLHDIKYEKAGIGESLLIYDVECSVFPPVFNAPLPPGLPDFDLVNVERSGKDGFLTFRNNKPVPGLRVRLHVDVTGYSSVERAFSWNEKEIKVRVPFPDRTPVKIKTYFDYYGLTAASSEKEFEYSSSEGEIKQKEGVVFLSGISGIRKLDDQEIRLCEKEVKLEIDRRDQQISKIRFFLFSPFQFEHPYWYGDYCQQVRIALDNIPLKEEELKDGENCVEVDLQETRLNPGLHIITLRFKYHFPFDFASLWKTAAFWDKLEIE